jgi:hypothetical protein
MLCFTHNILRDLAPVHTGASLRRGWTQAMILNPQTQAAT